MPSAIDVTAQRFGRLVALEKLQSSTRATKKTIWKCLCDCGNTAEINLNALRKGATKSCGCLRRELITKNNITHGKTKSPEYRCWSHIKKRCLNQNDAGWQNYGGRGITICKEWENDFQSFYAYIGPRPHSKASVDRIDNERGYEPGNVRWATRTEQARNTRLNRLITLNGKTQCLSDWAEQLGVNYQTLHSRFARGWSAEKALTKPFRKSPSKLKRK